MIKRAFALAAVALMMAAASLALTPPAYAEDGARGSLSLGYDGGISAEISLLQPQQTYYFPVEFGREGEADTLPASRLDSLSLEQLDGGRGIAAAELVGWRGASYLKLVTNNTRTQGVHTTAYRLTYRDSRGEEHTHSFSVRTGLRPASIGGYVPGSTIAVQSHRPLYTVQQQMELARQNSWRPVTFAGEGWSFTGTLTARGPVDFSVSDRAIPEVRRFLDGEDVFYLSFPGGGNFQNGRLTVDVSELADSWTGPVYAYRYLYGRLYRVPAVYDSDTGSITLSVTNLGRYAITDKKLPEATVVE